MVRNQARLRGSLRRENAQAQEMVREVLVSYTDLAFLDACLFATWYLFSLAEAIRNPSRGHCV